MDQIQIIRNSFVHFGVEAVFDPDGQAETILLIPSMGDDVVGFGGSEIVANGTVFEIQANEWNALGQQKPVFLVNGERRQVKAPPRKKDSRGLVLILDSQKASA